MKPVMLSQAALDRLEKSVDDMAAMAGIAIPDPLKRPVSGAAANAGGGATDTRASGVSGGTPNPAGGEVGRPPSGTATAMLSPATGHEGPGPGPAAKPKRLLSGADRDATNRGEAMHAWRFALDHPNRESRWNNPLTGDSGYLIALPDVPAASGCVSFRSESNRREGTVNRRQGAMCRNGADWEVRVTN